MKKDHVAILSVQETGFGAERVLANLVNGLPSEFADRCLLVRPAHSGLARWTAGGSVRGFDWHARHDKTSRNLLASLRAARELRGQGIGVVHGWGVRAFEPAVVLAALLGARVSGTLHDHPRADYLGRARRVLLRATAPRLRPLVCASSVLADTCRSTGLDVDITVIRSGLPPLPGAGADARSRRGGAVRAGFLGLYARLKGFETVREWIDRAGVEVEWHLYGEPAADLRAACADLQARRLPNVVFHGWVDGAGAMDQIDVLVHASNTFDTYPTVLLEAARAGIPALASDVGGSREIVEHGVTGFLFSTTEVGTGYDRLMALALDADLRKRMGAAARRRFEEEFGLSRMVTAYVDLWCSADS